MFPLRSSSPSLSRRSFLRGAGVTLALPFLEALAPRVAAELQVEGLLHGNGAAAVAALVPGAKRIEKQRVEFTLSIRFEQKNAGKRRENTRS